MGKEPKRGDTEGQGQGLTGRTVVERVFTERRFEDREIVENPSGFHSVRSTHK